jgi:UDP-N-acetylmuramoylalanine--D-glutamate ligase
MRVLIVGLGVSGLSAARVLAGLDAKVRVTESSDGPQVQQRAEALRALGVEVEVGGHDLEAAFADVAVISPGIPLDAPVVAHLAGQGIAIWSEIELGFRLGRGQDFVAVTGTNGKTTTTGLLAAMLDESGVGAVAAGNIGAPLVDAVFETPPEGVIVVEVSSFQLATIDLFRPRVAVLLNIDEDHTDWHGSVAAYAAAKERITLNQTPSDALVFNFDDERCRAIATRAAARPVPFSRSHAPATGIGVADREVLWHGEPLLSVADIPLAGVPGLEDTMAAAAAALEYGADGKAIVRALKGFRAPSHRMELVTDVASVSYIDDSKATNPHATLAAVQGLSDVVLIAGGRSKGIDLSRLRSTVPPVRSVVAMGEAADEIERVFSDVVPVRRAADMTEAVELATGMSVPGGSVLLSPGCASLDMYESYAARGEEFARAVKRLLEVERPTRSDDGDS